jgi:hypothetical protein
MSVSARPNNAHFNEFSARAESRCPADTRVRIVPPGSFAFSGQAATKYLELGLSSSATIECTSSTALGDASDIWTVTSSYGTLTYQP